MRILVTGANGFIGRHLLPRLAAAGAEVYGVGRLELDLLDGAARRAMLAKLRPSHLIHLAWTTEHGRYWQDPRNEDWRAASLALVDEFAVAGGRHALFAGSCAEQGEGLADTPYGRAKAALQRQASAWAATLGLPLAWGRIWFPFGPGEAAPRLVPSLARQLLAGQPAATGPAGLERDFVYVEDLADMLAFLSMHGHTGSLDLCSGEGVSIGAVAQELARLTGRPELLRLGALPGRPREAQRLVGNAAGLRALGWAGPAVGLREGLRRSVEALKTC